MTDSMRKLFAAVFSFIFVVLSCTSTPEENVNDAVVVHCGPDANEMELYRYYAGADTPAPKGYRLFYMSHYGRHGSRAAIEPERLSPFYDVLEWGHETDALTPYGDSLYNDVKKVAAMAEGRYGHLTQKGVQQLRGIAQRMSERFPELFADGNRVRCLSSIYSRCILSMTSFTNTLAAEHPDLIIEIDTGDRHMQYLNGVGTASMRPIIIKRLEFMRNPVDGLAQLGRIFTDPKAALKKIGDYDDFSLAFYSVASMAPNLEEEVDLMRYLDPEEMAHWWNKRNTYGYMMTCNSKEYGSMRLPMMKNAIEMIVRQADEAVAGNGAPAADFRFGHDYALLTILNYFNLEFLPQGLEPEEVCGKFRSSDYISMASNIQIPFYRNDAGDVLVKILHNEKEQPVSGLVPVSGPYYRWEDVRNMLLGQSSVK